tara:strand:- start:105 stop:479 length:375 start_codon:yes stop_codon:yes gene_type:complete
MDYEKFKKEYESFDLYMQDYRSAFELDEHPIDADAYINKFPSASHDDVLNFPPDDRVNSPSHYTGGRVEAIDVIEDAIKDAPDPATGMLQAQVLKYLLRLWLKDNPIEDAKKARWYLDRLITKL